MTAPTNPGAFHTCPGCDHAFRTEAALVAEENAVRDRIRSVIGGAATDATSGGEVYACPRCSHDW